VEGACLNGCPSGQAAARHRADAIKPVVHPAIRRHDMALRIDLQPDAERLWEVVAVPDLRQQNWELARRLAHAQWVGGEGL
jgi:hypothetical protein